jgi:predicted patatin/cPLA2 family phospholipase
MSTLYDVLDAHRKNKKDKRIFGLVLQGGGMRAVYSAGAIAPLIEYGFNDTFEHVVGSSAGAINGAYFLGADTETMLTYTDDLTNKNFVNLMRRDKKVDIDYLVDLVMKHKRPVNVPNMLKAHSQLHVVMTDARSGKKVVISNHHKFANIYEEFRATAALPLLYDKKVLIDGKYYIDGGVADLLPVDVAIKLGCTDIVVVMTQQISSYHFDKRHTRLVNHLIKRFAKDQPSAVRKVLPTNERLLQVNLRRLSQPQKKVRIYVLEPSDEEILISLYTTDKPKVETLARLGVSDMDNFLHAELAAK